MTAHRQDPPENSVFLASFLAERGRWVLWLPVLIGIGIAVYFSIPEEPPLWSGPAVVVLAAAFAWRTRYDASAALVAGIAMTALAVGFSAATWRTAVVASPLLERDIGPTRVEGQVILVERQPKALRVTLQSPRIAALTAAKTPHRVRLRLAGAQPAITPGDWISVRAVVKPPSPPTAPGAFDFQRHSYFKRLGGVGFGLGPARVTARAGHDGLDGLRIGVERLRAAISKAVTDSLPAMSGAIASALMTGDRSAIDAPTLQAIRDSGLAHLLAISGLHIGLVAGILFFVVRAGLALVPALALRHPIKKWAAVAAIAGAFAYAQIAGATVPTQRAFLMVGLVLLAVLVDRRGISLRLVAWAAAVILLVQPESLLGPSFQMSFAAVTALIAAYEAARRRSRGAAGWGRKLTLYASGVAFTTVIAGAATAPFALFHFNHVALYSVAANLIAVPVTALWVMPFALLAFLLMPFGLHGLALAAMGAGVDAVIAVANTVSAWPGGQAYVPALPTAGLAIAALGGLWLCLWARRWRFWGVPVLAAGLASVALTTPPDILVDGKGRLMAVKDASGALVFSESRYNSFSRKAWLARAGFPAFEKPQLWPRTTGEAAADGKLRCDGAGCLYQTNGRTAALVRRAEALAEDCASADVVVTALFTRNACPATPLIDRASLIHGGAHAVWITEKGVEIHSVNEGRGNRPWVVREKRRY